MYYTLTKEENMHNEIKAPILCLKLNVPRALYNGERVPLDAAPIKHGGKTLVPYGVLEMLDVGYEGDLITVGDDAYAELDLIGDICSLENEMGLIFFDGEPITLTTEKDVDYMLELAHRFIFEIKVGRLAPIPHYAPATEEERADFMRVGTEIRDMLLERGNTHPFLFGTQDIFDKLRAIYSSGADSEEKGFIEKLIKEADEYAKTIPALNENGDGLVEDFPPPDYGGNDYDAGGRHYNSEAHLSKIAHLAFAYQITLDEKYARLAYFGSLAVIRRKHWGPGHFLNCSGATMRLVRVYDWLVNAWNDMGLDSQLIKRGIYDQGIHHGYNSAVLDTCDYPSPQQGTGWRFKLKPDNWNSVCNSGMIIGALCILNDGVDEVISEDEYRRAPELLGASITSTMQPHLVFTQYAPDGSYEESNSYWAYGTTNLVNSMASLYSALGTDLGLHHACGFDKTCYYAINAESAEFIGWNYHDGGLGSQNTYCFNPLGVISGDSSLFAIRLDHLRRGKSVALMDMMFYPTLRGLDIPELSALPLDYHMEGIDAITVRNGWQNGSLDAGMIGGRNPEGGSHCQLDSGAFVYHNLGKMWFTDMGSDNYNSHGIENGIGYFGNYALYRRNAEGNNCLCLESLPYGQLLGGRGAMTEYKSGDGISYAIIDNAQVYGNDKVEYAKRGMLLTNSRTTLIIKDEVKFHGEENAFATAHFESDKISAEISNDGKRCTLTHKDGERIFVTLLGDGKMEIMSCDGILSGTAPATGEYSRENHSRIVVRHKGVESINTSFVIDTNENSSYNENINMDMWKTI